jgi:hypothetical protein
MKHLFVVLVTLLLGTSAALACQAEAMDNADADRSVPQQTSPESAS